MASEEDCRLNAACKCLELPRPRREDWLRLSDKECSKIAEHHSVLSDPIRVRILDMLGKGPLYVCLIQYLLEGISNSKLSYHLDILKKAGLVTSKRQGSFVLYKLTKKGYSALK